MNIKKRTAWIILLGAFLLTIWIFCGFAAVESYGYPTSNNSVIQMYINRLSGRVPLYSVQANLTLAFCPGAIAAGGCSERNGQIFIAPDDLGPFTVGHELGHRFDEQFFTDGIRNKIERVMHIPVGTPWIKYTGEDSLKYCVTPNANQACPNEWFADGFSSCANERPAFNGPARDADVAGPYGMQWTVHIQKQLCRIIIKVGAAAEGD